MQQQNELLKKSITITGFDSASYDNGGMKTVLLVGKDKYFFYNKTKEGKITKAQEGYDALRPRIGDCVEIAYTEQPDSFVNSAGKTINYTKRRIMAFNTNGAQMETRQAPRPAATPAPAASNTQLDRIETLLKDIAASMGIKTIMGSPMEKAVATTPAPVGTMGDGQGEMYQGIPTVNVDEVESDIKIDEVPF